MKKMTLKREKGHFSVRRARNVRQASSACKQNSIHEFYLDRFCEETRTHDRRSIASDGKWVILPMRSKTRWGKSNCTYSIHDTLYLLLLLTYGLAFLGSLECQSYSNGGGGMIIRIISIRIWWVHYTLWISISTVNNLYCPILWDAT